MLKCIRANEGHTFVSDCEQFWIAPNSCRKEFFFRSHCGIGLCLSKRAVLSEHSTQEKVEVRRKLLEKEQMIAALKSTEGKTGEFDCKYGKTVQTFTDERRTTRPVLTYKSLLN